MTVTTCSFSGIRVTVKTASSPSATGAASPIRRPGAGSARIIPRPVGSASVLPPGFLSSTVNVSLSSVIVSSSTGTRMVFVVSRGSKRRVPVTGV